MFSRITWGQKYCTVSTSPSVIVTARWVMLWNEQHKFRSCSLTSPASLRISLHSFGLHASSCLLAPPQQHVFYGPHGRGSKDRKSSAGKESCSTKVTHAALATMAVPDYKKWRGITLCVPLRKKELNIGINIVISITLMKTEIASRGLTVYFLKVEICVASTSLFFFFFF